MISFNVFYGDINKKKVDSFDIMPFLIKKYHKNYKEDYSIKEFILNECKYMFAWRCEYELIVSSWPTGFFEQKYDVYDQIVENIDAIVFIFNCNLKYYESMESIE